ncbi:MAG: hypothetical protein AAGA33_08775 [Pseudomonadota bacterium]
MSTTHSVYVVAGPIGLGRLDERSREKLKHAQLAAGSDRVAPAARLAEHLGLAPTLLNRAATRYRGECGRTVKGWIAAADPVYLEPRLDHLCLMSQDVDDEEREALLNHLNAVFVDDGLRFVIEGRGLYLQAETPIASSSYPTSLIDGLLPNKYLPSGDGVDDFRTRLAEIEMSLHEHPLNQARQSRGQKPINSLWLWGGGVAEAVVPQSLPPLYSGDALLRGLWSLHGSAPRDRDDDPAIDDGPCVLDIGDDLTVVTELLERGRSMLLFSRDGLTLDASGSGRWRFWARRHAELEPPA